MAWLGFHKRSRLRWPTTQVDPGREFMGAVSQLLAKHSVQGRRGRVDIFTGTKASWSASFGRWLNASSGTRMPRRCDSHPVNGPQSW